MQNKKWHLFSSVWLILVLISTLSISTNSQTLVEIFGMGELLEDLAKLKVSNIPGANPQVSSAYMLDPSIYTFLRQFPTRTEFCSYKCKSFFNMPCFIFFGCNIQIRNFVIILVVPIFLLALTGICCGRGIWTFRCFLKYFAVFTGIAFLIWTVKKCTQGATIRDRKVKQKEKQFQNQYEVEPQNLELHTAERFQKRRTQSSSEYP